jgi:hypothetical protein
VFTVSLDKRVVESRGELRGGEMGERRIVQVKRGFQKVVPPCTD